MNEEKYEMNRYYVGVLHIDFISNYKTYFHNSKDEKWNMTVNTAKNGAKALSFFVSEYGFEQILESYRYLSIFYQLSDTEYLCLHNGKIVGIDTEQDCSVSDFMPLTACLPKVGYAFPMQIDIREGIDIFAGIYDRAEELLEPYRNQFVFDQDKYQVGEVKLLVSEEEQDNTKNYAVPVRYLLQTNGKVLMPYHEDGKHFFACTCLNYALSAEEFVCLNNNQIYRVDPTQEGVYSCVDQNIESTCYYLRPLATAFSSEQLEALDQDLDPAKVLMLAKQS